MFTFRQQKLNSTQVTLAGSHHEQRSTLLVADVNVSTMLQQQLCNLKNDQKKKKKKEKLELKQLLQIL